jgi:NAD+ diphosphatase
MCVGGDGHVPRGPAGDAIYLGELDGEPCFAREADVGAATVPLRQLFGVLSDEAFGVAGRALALLAWDRDHKHCGRCGAPTERAREERLRVCTSCKFGAYPRLSPAVIMLVERDDGRALLARNALFPPGIFSCLSGFVEPGETLEHAVCREVKEEVGLEVGDVDFRGSQPWPFPHQLMVGFGARYRSGEITLDEKEIVEAAWFTAADAPVFPTNMSIAGRLIDEWRSRPT